MTLLLDIPDARPSPLHRLDPRWKLTALAVAVPAVALVRTPGPALLALALALTLALVARLPPRWLAGRVGVALMMLALFAVWLPLLPRPGHDVWDVGGVSVSVTGLVLAVVLLAKAAAIVTLVLVVLATAPLHDTFKAAHRLRVPGLLVQLVLMRYRYVFLLADEFARLRTALRVRGYRNRMNLHSYRTAGQVAGTLLVRGHERSDRVAQAMRCRGFDGEFRSLHDFRARPSDVLLLAAALAVAAGLVAWDGVLR
jgi:cobalt/nickel transport system permease protein